MPDMTKENAQRKPVENPRVVEMIRVSTMGQADRGTPEIQRKDLEGLRNRTGGRLVAQIEAALSGNTDLKDRTDLQQLLALAAEKAFDELRVWRIDRLTRHEDPRERFLIYGAVKDAGAIIVDATGHSIDPATELGELDYYLQTFFAKKERLAIITRIRGGIVKALASGKAVAGTAPWGRTFDKRTREFGVHAETIAVYREMFMQALNGASMEEIADWLDQRGVLSPRGGTWSVSSVYHLLHAKHAIGIYEWKRHGITINIPPVVDEDTFQVVAAKIKANGTKQAGPRGRLPAILRKVGICGACGSRLYTYVGSRKSVMYYMCSRAHAARRDKSIELDDGCRVLHRADKLDPAVRDVLLAFLHDPKLAVGTVMKNPKGLIEEAKQAVKEAERELKDLDGQEERLGRLLRKGLMSEHGGEKQLAEIQSLRLRAQSDLERAKTRLAAAAQSQHMTKEVEAKIERLRKNCESASPEALREALVAMCDDAGTGVRVFPDGRFEVLALLDGRDSAEIAGVNPSRSPHSTGGIHTPENPQNLARFPFRLLGGAAARKPVSASRARR